MVIKLKTVKCVEQTDIENYILLVSLSKVEVFDLRKREIIATFAIRNPSYFSVMYKNFAANLAQDNCVIDLDKLQIVKKFNAYAIIQKQLLKPEYRSEKFRVEEYGSGVVEITDDKLLYKARYFVTDCGVTDMWEKYSHICEFDIASWKLLRYYDVPYNYVHKTDERKLPFLQDDIAAMQALEEKILPANRGKYDRAFFYNSVYNVANYRVNDIQYIKYLSDSDLDEKNTAAHNESNELLIKSKQPGFNIQDYIRKNGLTREVLDTFDDLEILDGGYFWALDRIDALAEQSGQGFTEYLKNHALPLAENILYSIGLLESEIENDGFFNFITGGSVSEFNRMIAALKSVEAKKTAKTLEKGKRLMLAFEGLDEKTEKDYRAFEDKSIEIEEELDSEDYVGMAINYLRERL